MVSSGFKHSASIRWRLLFFAIVVAVAASLWSSYVIESQEKDDEEEPQGIIVSGPTPTSGVVLQTSRQVSEAAEATGCDASTETSRDCDTLLGLKDTLAGDATLNWSKDLGLEEWEGVGLGDSPPRVHALWLGFKSLNGTIPAALGRLDQLRFIDFQNNQLMGEIPPELGDLHLLEELTLGVNQLTGRVPAEIGELPNLNWLDVRANQISGCVPVNTYTVAGLWDDLPVCFDAVITVDDIGQGTLDPILGESVTLRVAASPTVGGDLGYTWQEAVADKGWVDQDAASSTLVVSSNVVVKRTFRVVVERLDTGETTTSAPVSINWVEAEQTLESEVSAAVTGYYMNGEALVDLTLKVSFGTEGEVMRDLEEVCVKDQSGNQSCESLDLELKLSTNSRTTEVSLGAFRLAQGTGTAVIETDVEDIEVEISVPERVAVGITQELWDCFADIDVQYGQTCGGFDTYRIHKWELEKINVIGRATASA